MASTTTTRKSTRPDTKTVTTRKTAAKKTSTKAPAKATAPKVKKSDIPEDQRDWTYLADKEPTDLHEDFAVWLQQEVGIEVDLKTVQAVCVLRMVYQRSDRNKARSAYRGLDEATVGQRSVHMIAAAQDAKRIREEQAAKADASKKAAAAKRAATRAAKAQRTAAEAPASN